MAHELWRLPWLGKAGQGLGLLLLLLRATNSELTNCLSVDEFAIGLNRISDRFYLVSDRFYAFGPIVSSRTNDRPLRSAPHNLPEGDGLGWRSQNFGGRVKIVCMRCIHPSFHPYVVHPVIDLADDDDRIDRHKS